MCIYIAGFFLNFCTMTIMNFFSLSKNKRSNKITEHRGKFKMDESKKNWQNQTLYINGTCEKQSVILTILKVLWYCMY